jgi:hypothetical protein
MLEIHRSRSSLANSSQPRCTISNRVPSGQSVLLRVACFDFCDRSSLNTTIRRYCRGVRSAGHPIWRATVSAFTAAGSSWYSRNSYRTPSVSSSHTALVFMLFSVAYQVRLAVSPDSPKRPGRFPAPAAFSTPIPAASAANAGGFLQTSLSKVTRRSDSAPLSSTHAPGHSR